MIGTAEAKQVSRAASSVLFPELDFGVTDNDTYPSGDFQRVPAWIAFDNAFANADTKAYQLSRSDEIDVRADSWIPMARAMLYIFAAPTRTQSNMTVNRIRDAVLPEAARTRLFTHLINVAIDVRDWLLRRQRSTARCSD